MKFNWGHGLTVVIAIGVAGILTLVYLSTKQKIDLVTDDYYPRELVYEKQIQKQRNTQSLDQKILMTISDTITFHFPELSNHPSEIKGKILFYRPSDRTLDREEPVILDSAFKQKYPASLLKQGKFEVIIEWEYNQVEYLQKEIVSIQ